MWRGMDTEGLEPCAAPAEEMNMEAYSELIIAILGAVVASGALSTVVSSNRWWMRLIDALALNWGKARNSDDAQ